MQYVTNQQAKGLSKKYHNTTTHKHTCRVADYISTSPIIPNTIRRDCITLAYMHDLVEDIDFKDTDTFKNMGEPLKTALLLISKEHGTSYDEYCQMLHDNAGTIPGKIAWYVKIADMKDHMVQTETLSDRLKEKYLSGLRFLL